MQRYEMEEALHMPKMSIKITRKQKPVIAVRKPDSPSKHVR